MNIKRTLWDFYYVVFFCTEVHIDKIFLSTIKSNWGITKSISMNRESSKFSFAIISYIINKFSQNNSCEILIITDPAVLPVQFFEDMRRKILWVFFKGEIMSKNKFLEFQNFWRRNSNFVLTIFFGKILFSYFLKFSSWNSFKVHL